MHLKQPGFTIVLVDHLLKIKNSKIKKKNRRYKLHLQKGT